MGVASDVGAQGNRQYDLHQVRSDCVGVDGVRVQSSNRARAGKSVNSGANSGSKYLPGQHGPAATVRPAGPAISSTAAAAAAAATDVPTADANLLGWASAGRKRF